MTIPPFYNVEVIDPTGLTVDTIDNPISLVAARSYTNPGNAVLTLLPQWDEEFFRYNMRFKLWRTDAKHGKALFGDTIWFLRKFTHQVSLQRYVVEMADALTLLSNPVIAYTAQTPYADKTLEELGDITYDDYYRIDNLMKEYVRENFGPDALDVARINPYIVVEQNLNLAPYGEKTASWAKLNSVLSDLARMSAEKGMELFYDLIPQSDSTFLFRVWRDIRGADRGFFSSESTIFSDENGDLDDVQVVYDYSQMATYCYVLGYDTGPSQIIVEVGNTAIIESDPFGRIEFTTNSTDNDVSSVLQADGQAALYGLRPRRILSAKLSAASSLRYGTDFAYGDRVGVQVGGRRYDCQISAVRAEWQQAREVLDIRLDGSESLWNPTYWADEGETPAPIVTPAPSYADPPPVPGGEPFDSGLVSGQEAVVLVSTDANLYRTADFQTPSGSGGPTWDSFATGIAETIYSFVVDPFSPGYISGVGSIDGWIVTETDIYRVEDMFGVTPSVASVHTFGTANVAASFHWRSIQASFGAFFETGNPWLLCISYYGDIAGHEGTWATRSLDGGATWETEVQINDIYASTALTRFDPIGVYTSPKTPGLAYTVARNIAELEGLPMWVTWDNDGNPYVATGPSLTKEWVVLRLDDSAGPSDSGNDFLNIAPPTNTARVKVAATWSCTNVRSGSSSTAAIVSIASPGANVTHTDDLVFTAPPGSSGTGATTSGSFEMEFTLTNPVSNNWPGTIPQIGTAQGDQTSDFGIQVQANMAANGSVANPASIELTMNFRILEIELEDSTLYTFPDGDSIGKVSEDWGATWADTTLVQAGQAVAGSIHLPWPNNDDEGLAYYGSFNGDTNRQFRLKRMQAGTLNDISPTDGSILYGVNRFGFAVRTYDSNRRYIVASVIGNDTTADAADDKHAIYISDDFGATWAEVVAPTVDAVGFENRPAFEAAFAGDTEQVLYIWGPPDTISYSSNFGAAVDDRSGNLAGTGVIIGIAGGPIA